MKCFHSGPHHMNCVNPLTPELNPSEQCCLLEFFTGDFKF